MASLNHPQIIGYKEAFFEEATNSLCIIMEYAEGGDLQSLINTTKRSGGNISETDAWKYVIQMVNGIKYLHEMGIVHRDLKVRNITTEFSISDILGFGHSFQNTQFVFRNR